MSCGKPVWTVPIAPVNISAGICARLQEEFDTRLRLQGWATPGFVPDQRWVPAMKLDSPSDKPAICGHYFDYLEDKDVANIAEYFLRRRDIPLTRKFEVPAMRLAESGSVKWRCDPFYWFEYRAPGSFTVTREPLAIRQGEGIWQLPETPDVRSAIFATFEFKDEVAGFPYFTIEAPEGTVVELICQEAHNPAGTAWLDTGWYSWSRLICREGTNRFEVFDYESIRWLQLHIRNVQRPVTVSKVGVRRRIYGGPHEPHVQCSEPTLQRLFDACINTLENGIQDGCPCEFIRERPTIHDSEWAGTACCPRCIR
jgi:alpha-L-rhamnosidase